MVPILILFFFLFFLLLHFSYSFIVSLALIVPMPFFYFLIFFFECFFLSSRFEYFPLLNLSSKNKFSCTLCFLFVWTENIYQDSFTLNLKQRLFYTEMIVSKTSPLIEIYSHETVLTKSQIIGSLSN